MHHQVYRPGGTNPVVWVFVWTVWSMPQFDLVIKFTQNFEIKCINKTCAANLTALLLQFNGSNGVKIARITDDQILMLMRWGSNFRNICSSTLWYFVRQSTQDLEVDKLRLREPRHEIRENWISSDGAHFTQFVSVTKLALAMGWPSSVTHHNLSILRTLFGVRNASNKSVAIPNWHKLDYPPYWSGVKKMNE